MAVDMDKVSRYIELDDEIKLRKEEQDGIKDNLKVEMIADGVRAVKHQNRTLSLTESSRETVKKDDLVALLGKKGLRSCIKMVLEPDMDMLEQAIQNGEITQAEVDAFVKKTPVFTMKLK
jgi:hypothetical protein